MHVVGNGQISRVYKAILDQEIVAVKIYAAVETTESDERNKIKDIITNEIEIWKKLSHPNILQFRSRGVTIGATEGLRTEFVISPFIHYGSVGSYLGQMRWNYNGALGWSKFVDERMIFLGTAQGMEYLHSERILHRNLKVSFYTNCKGL